MLRRLTVLLVAALCLATGALAISANGTFYTIAGTGATGFAGDGGRATAATLSAPADVAVDGEGNVYIADSGNHVIRKLTPAGVITTIAGTGRGGFSGDGGPATSAQLSAPQGIALDGRANVYVADTGNNRIRRIAADGTIRTVAGTGVADQSPEGSIATQADLNQPAAVAVDGAGSLYIAEEDRVLKLLGDGTLQTVAGALFSSGFNGDNIPGPAALLDSPSGLAADAAGNVYIADSDNHRVRKVGTDGIIRTLAGTGNPNFGGDGGPATAASLNEPYDVTVAGDGTVYVTDRANHRVRKILANGTIVTVAGGGSSQQQFVSAAKVELGDLAGIAVNTEGSVYLAEVSKNRIDKVSDLITEVGTMGRAWVSPTRASSVSKTVTSSSRDIWAHFTFTALPEVGLPVAVQFIPPRGKVSTVPTPAASQIDAVFHRSGAGLATGRWRAVLRVANKAVKSVSFDVKRKK